MSDYINSALLQFKYYRDLGSKAIAQLAEKELFERINPEDNNIAIMVNHLWGNMLSRWTDFLTSDGEKEWRQRDLEFENVIKNKVELLKKWDEGWQCLFMAIENLNQSDLDNIVYIRNMGHTVTEAINRQLCHYSYHVGQIVFLAKTIKGKEWQSLSIPKGDSLKYNEDKFNKPQVKKHFTEDL